MSQLVQHLESALSEARAIDAGQTFTQRELEAKVSHYYEKGRTDSADGKGFGLFIGGLAVGIVGSFLIGAFV